MKQLLEIDSVILEFNGRRILQDVYLKSETGQITGLLGRNGTGKTCIMNIIYGELIPYNKMVRLNGKPLDNAYRYPEIIRYLPQFSFIPKNLSIRNIFDDFKIDFERFINYFPEFKDIYNSKINKLSGGTQRIIEIYILLVSKTKFCMLDEPFSQVMPIHMQTIKNIIIDEKKNKGIIITDHLYEHVVDICDSTYVISKGTVFLTKNLHDLERLGYLRKNTFDKL